jgi:endonuclease/exonuclease/phosphatase family metal-dependent hydrolase
MSDYFIAATYVSSASSSMKIFFANCGYLTGLTGRPDEYVFLLWRYLIGSSNVTVPFIDTLKEEDPDVCLLVEMKSSHIMDIYNALPQYEHIVTVEKYGKGLLSKIGKRNIHAVLSKKPIENTREILFNQGNKKSILLVSIGGIDFYVCHLSLKARTRSFQIRQLETILVDANGSIIAGDFNVFKGDSELESFEKKGIFYSLNTKNQNTFPAYNPKIKLDYIYATQDVHGETFKILPEIFSDHRALCCTINR